MSWITIENDNKIDYLNNNYGYDTKLLVNPQFYNPNFSYNNSWKFQLGNQTPSNIHLLVSKELNFLLMEQDLTRFRREECGLDSSQQLEYLKNKNMDTPSQEIFSYIKHADLSQYDQSGQLPTFNPKPSYPKKKKNFKPSIPYDRNVYGISSSNLLTLQIVESLSYGNNTSQKQNNLTNTDVIMDMRKKENIIGISSEQVDTYLSPADNNQIPFINGKIYNREPRLYKQSFRKTLIEYFIKFYYKCIFCKI